MAIALVVPASTEAAYVRVAGPTASGVVLEADREGGVMCLRFARGNTVSRGNCSSVNPGSPWFVADRVDGIPVAGAAMAEGVSVEVQDLEGRRVRTDARVVGDQRYAISEHPAGARPWLLRQFDLSGALIQATEVNDKPFLRGPETLAKGLSGSIEAFLSPVPGELDRIRTTPCLIETRRDGTVTQCRNPVASLRPPVDDLERGGSRRVNGRQEVKPWSWIVVTSPHVAALEAVLGDGSRLRRATRPYPAALGSDQRWARIAIPRGAAIRVLRIVNAAGATLGTLAERRPPVTLLNTAYPGNSDVPVPYPAGGRPVTPAFGTPPVGLLAQDVEGDLCLRLEAEVSCSPPFSNPRQGFVAGYARTNGEGGVIAGAVTPQITSVRLTLRFPEEKAARAVATQPMPDYGGRWHPHLRTFATEVTDQGAYSVELLDSRGKTLREGTADVFQSGGYDRYRIAARPRLPSGGRVVLGNQNDGNCWAILRGADPVAEDCLDEVSLVSACSPRVTLATVWVRKDSVREVTGRTREGRTLRGQKLPLGRGLNAAVIAVPAREHLTSVTWQQGGRLRHHKLGSVPSAREQCGYAASYTDAF